MIYVSTVGLAMCGSFCTVGRAIQQMKLLREQYDILPIMSQNLYTTDTRFGRASDIISQVEEISGRQVLHTIVDTEPIGPKKLVNAMVVCPCTGNTLSKIAAGITDTSVTMAVKSSLRIGIPVLLCVASNDSLAASGAGIARLVNTKNIFLVPMRQDDPVKKPFSLVADFSLLPQCVAAAMAGQQVQPIFC